MNKIYLKTLLPGLLILFFISNTFAQKVSVKHEAWTRSQTIYEVNVRQFSNEGTFKKVEESLPKLKSMGVGIVWLMPVHPIGQKNKKGSLGSFYAVQDYYAVDPSYGSFDDFKSLVNKVHSLGMHIIIDWVANHTAWDNALLTEHPNYYKKDSSGKFISPFDWDDVAALDYKNKELWAYMTDALKYWVEKAGIDGFRCDAAGLVPTDYWEYASAELNKIKPVFMLAEWEDPKLHSTFDMTYCWELHKIINDIAVNKKSVADIDSYFAREDTAYPADAYRMIFITNHDENSWHGTEYERLGAGVEASAVFCATIKAMPLIYNGQEVGLSKRISFFEKDPIEWKEGKQRSFYSKLLNLKMTNKALRNGEAGGKMIRMHSEKDSSVYSFVREKDDDKIFVVLNLSGKEQKFTLNNKAITGAYTELFSDELMNCTQKEAFNLRPWEYRVYVKQAAISK